MAQGAVKKTGKRSQAVSAKKQAILGRRAGGVFAVWHSRHAAGAGSGARPGYPKPICSTTTRRKRRSYVAVMQQILDIWLAPLESVPRRSSAPLVAIREYIRLKLEVSRDHPQASKLFCLEMLQGAPLLMG